jgi:hypothetical protein
VIGESASKRGNGSVCGDAYRGYGFWHAGSMLAESRKYSELAPFEA